MHAWRVFFTRFTAVSVVTNSENTFDVAKRKRFLKVATMFFCIFFFCNDIVACSRERRERS